MAREYFYINELVEFDLDKFKEACPATIESNIEVVRTKMNNDSLIEGV